MPAPSKPLVSPRLLAREAAALAPPTDAQRAAAARWARTAADPTFVGQNEKPHQGKFLADLFGTVLGYRQFADAPDAYELKAESASSETAGGKTPDATLGRYGVDQSGRTVAVVELKAPGADLDAPQRRAARLTPVEQGFGYVSKFDGCRWVIVSNFTHVRLYRADRGEGYAVEVRVADLGDDQTLRQLLVVLHRDRLLGRRLVPAPPTGSSRRRRRRRSKSRLRSTSSTATPGSDSSATSSSTTRRRTGRPLPEHERALLAAAQTLLDRTLFVCFCEDTGLLPREVLRQALTAAGTGFVTTSRWDQLRGLFRAVDQGNASPRINAYNGGLFAPDSVLDALSVPDDALAPLLDIAAYDFNSDLSVDILGRIFERSIADLEALHAAIDGGDAPARSKRKSDGVFYTPEFVTRFVVAQTVGAWLAEQFEAARAANDVDALPASYTKQRARTERALWLDYQDRLRRIKVLDPACGSGAFLVAAFDYLHAEYQRVNRRLASFEGGQAGLFDLDRQILQENLYGVDLNAESVEITRLSLWLRRRGPTGRSLTSTRRSGRATRSSSRPSPAMPSRSTSTRSRPRRASAPSTGTRRSPRCSGATPAATARRQPTRSQEGSTACSATRPTSAPSGSRTSSRTSPRRSTSTTARPTSTPTSSSRARGSWRRAGSWPTSSRTSGCGQATASRSGPSSTRTRSPRRSSTSATRRSSRTPTRSRSSCRSASRTTGRRGGDPTVQVATVPRERLRESPLAQFVAQEAFRVPWSRFSAEPWSLEPEEARDLVTRIQDVGTPLAEFAGVEPYSGIKTGLNAAFLVDDDDKRALVAADSSAAEILVPYVRGSDVERWEADWKGQWMLALASSGNRDWPWTEAADPEAVFRETYPSVYARFEPLRERLIKRTDQGVHWWELRSCDYYDLFDAPKISYQEIQFHPQYALDTAGLYGNNKVHFLPTNDRYLLGVLNSPLMWWYAWRTLPHMKDDALSPARYLMKAMPIAEPSAETRDTVETHVTDLVRLTDESRQQAAQFLDWLRIEHGVATPGRKLESFWTLDDATFAREVKKRSGHSKLSPALLREILDYFAESTMRLALLEGSVLAHERAISEAVFDAYGLTPDERALVWKTAPPRMPLDALV